MSANVSALLSKAITHVMWTNEFFGALLARVEIKADENQPTAATDGKTIWYNPEFIEGLTTYETAGVVVHEVLHCAMLHALRHGNRDFGLWAKSCDYAINLLIEDIPGMQLPADCLLDQRFADMSAEEIYEILREEQQSGDGDNGKCFCGKLEENKEPAAEKKFLEQEWKAAVNHAVNEAKRAGTLPSSIEQMFKPILEPKLPWRDILYNFMDKPRDIKRNWKRPNKRYINMDIVLPSTTTENSGDFIMSVDVSGSMSDDMVLTVLNQVAYIVSIIRPNSVTIIQHDSTVKEPVTVIEADDEFPSEIEILGRGGTDFIPVFEYIEDNFDEPPSCLVMLTDGWGSYPDTPPDYPVLWVLVDEPELTMDYGEVAHVDSKNEISRAA